MQPDFAWGGGLIILRATPWRRLGNSNALQICFGSDTNQLIQHFTSEHLVQAVGVAGDRHSRKQVVRRGMQFEVFVRMRECVVRYQRSDVR